MTNDNLLRGALLAFLLIPIGAQAQGVVGGAVLGADQGSRDAGPVGAVVGGAIGAVAGGVNGLLGIDQRPRFHDYVVSEHRRSYRYAQEVRVGAMLPGEGVEYYDVPSDYGVRGYRYAVVNDQTVLVDPQTHAIVQIVQ